MAKNILVVDDSASFRQVVAMALKGAGYDVVEACDGRDALSKLDGRKVHLIVSDVNMPLLDGIGFVTEAKRIPDYRFVLTTVASEERKAEGKAAGVRAWVVKPFQPPVLLDAVSKLVL